MRDNRKPPLSSKGIAWRILLFFALLGPLIGYIMSFTIASITSWNKFPSLISIENINHTLIIIPNILLMIYLIGLSPALFTGSALLFSLRSKSKPVIYSVTMGVGAFTTVLIPPFILGKNPLPLILGRNLYGENLPDYVLGGGAGALAALLCTALSARHWKAIQA